MNLLRYVADEIPWRLVTHRRFQYAAARAMRQVVNLNWDAKSFGRSNGGSEILKRLAEHGTTERLRKHAGYAARSLKVYGIH